MHEASIALSILDIAGDHCRKAGFSAIRCIEVRIGAASGVMPEALRMAFDIAKLDTPAHEAALSIIEVPLGGTCRDCGSKFTTEEQFMLACPVCGGGNFKFETGRELDVSEIEVD